MTSTAGPGFPPGLSAQSEWARQRQYNTQCGITAPTCPRVPAAINLHHHLHHHRPGWESGCGGYVSYGICLSGSVQIFGGTASSANTNKNTKTEKTKLQGGRRVKQDTDRADAIGRSGLADHEKGEPASRGRPAKQATHLAVLYTKSFSWSPPRQTRAHTHPFPPAAVLSQPFPFRHKRNLGVATHDRSTTHSHPTGTSAGDSPRKTNNATHSPAGASAGRQNVCSSSDQNSASSTCVP